MLSIYMLTFLHTYIGMHNVYLYVYIYLYLYIEISTDFIVLKADADLLTGVAFEYIEAVCIGFFTVEYVSWMQHYGTLKQWNGTIL